MSETPGTSYYSRSSGSESILRLVVFTDVNSEVTRRIITATLRCARERSDVELVAVVVSRPDRFVLHGSWPRRVAREALVAACNSDVRVRDALARAVDLATVLRRQGVPILHPPGGDPNDPGFRRRLTDELGAEVALSVYSLRIFRQPLLDTFRHAVNFHNGLLPNYKGLMATSFAIYHDEPRAGYTFHHMTAAVDGGPVLLQGSVAIETGDRLGTVTARLARQAARDVPRVLELVGAGDPGRPQVGDGSYFSARDAQALVRVDDPAALDAAELERRVRAFGSVDVQIDGSWYAVTRLRSVTRPGGLAFRTRDAQLLTPDRLGGLPAWRRHLRTGLRRPAA